MASRLPLRLGFALVTTGLFLVVAEGVARFFPPPDVSTVKDSEFDGAILAGNPFLLWELMPGRDDTHGYTITVNSSGLRDKERGPKTRPRAMAVGDSSVYGFGVSDNEVFTSILEQKIDADFINAAIPGYSTLQTLNLLSMRGLKYDPDLLIIASLWSDNNFDSFVDAEVLAQYGMWEDSASGRLHRMLSNLNLFRWMDWELRVAPQGLEFRDVGWMVPDRPKGTRRRVPVNTYAANLDALCALMRDRGGGVVFVMLANREDITQSDAPGSWKLYRQVMTDTAARHNAPLVSLPDAFRASGRTVDELFIDAMHPSVLGHQLFADAVAATLQEKNWPTTPLSVQAGGPRQTYSDEFEAMLQAQKQQEAAGGSPPPPPPQGEPPPGGPTPGTPPSGEPMPGVPVGVDPPPGEPTPGTPPSGEPMPGVPVGVDPPPGEPTNEAPPPGEPLGAEPAPPGAPGGDPDGGIHTTENPPPPQPLDPMNHPAIDTPTDVSALTMELLPSGMKLYRVQQGTGDLPTAGQGVFLHAVGWESQGSKRKLFSSWDRGKPYLFSSSKLSDPYTTDIMQILQGLPVGSVIQLELPTDARIKKFDYILIQPMPVIIEIVVAKLYSANAPLPPP